MLAAGPKVSWQQYAPGHAPSSTFPRQGRGAGMTSLLSFDEVSGGTSQAAWEEVLSPARVTSLHTAGLSLGL